jgi:hypothetical protein
MKRLLNGWRCDAAAQSQHSKLGVISCLNKSVAARQICYVAAGNEGPRDIPLDGEGSSLPCTIETRTVTGTYEQSRAVAGAVLNIDPNRPHDIALT